MISYACNFIRFEQHTRRLLVVVVVVISHLVKMGILWQKMGWIEVSNLEKMFVL